VTDAALTVDGLAKRYAGTEVLRAISLEIGRGEFTTLLGPSGCGKTTLLRIIAGLELADRGTLRLGERDITALPADRRPINTVFQHFALFPHLDVFENIAFGLRSRRVPAADLGMRVAEALSMLHLGECARRHVDQLSGGQKQRVALARAMVNRPELLLLDEPMSALDAQLRAEVQLELRRLQRRLGSSFLLVTHDQLEAMTVSDRILVMDRGRIVQAGTPSEIYEHPRNRFVAGFLGAANLIAARRAPGGVATDFGELVADRQPDWLEGTVSIRPERIVVQGRRSEQNGVAGTIQEIVFRGGHQELFVGVSPLTQLRVHAPPGSAAIGQEIWLHIPAASVRVLDD
jgi:spermidine/putrescine transport system ATP-binding protein